VDVTAMTEEVSQSRGPRPRALIVTIYGLYARDAGGWSDGWPNGWLSVGSLIRLMSEVGVDEPAVRSSISRLKRRGILEAERVGGVAGYGLSAQARSILDEGDRRIFARPRATRDDGWVLAVFSVPESERQKRHMLRSRLTWLGFGTVGAGVWIAPDHVEAETRDVLERYGLAPYVDLFHAGYLGFGDVDEQVTSWWDIDGLQRLYEEFYREHLPMLRRWRRRRRVDEAAAFADYVRTLTAWRRLPYLDPGLPPDLLPADWLGVKAADLFFALRERLADPAHRHVLAVTGR
jgi:phenylacetic acid degradation operon negative regulatory protein